MYAVWCKRAKSVKNGVLWIDNLNCRTKPSPPTRGPASAGHGSGGTVLSSVVRGSDFRVILIVILGSFCPDKSWISVISLIFRLGHHESWWFSSVKYLDFHVFYRRMTELWLFPTVFYRFLWISMISIPEWSKYDDFRSNFDDFQLWPWWLPLQNDHILITFWWFPVWMDYILMEPVNSADF